MHAIHRWSLAVDREGRYESVTVDADPKRAGGPTTTKTCRGRVADLSIVEGWFSTLEGIELTTDPKAVDRDRFPSKPWMERDIGYALNAQDRRYPATAEALVTWHRIADGFRDDFPKSPDAVCRTEKE